MLPYYRLAEPRQVIGRPRSFVHNAWTASSFLAGEVKSKPDFVKILEVSRSFHEYVSGLKLERPAFLRQHPNRRREADLVIWSEKKLEDVDKVNYELLVTIQPVLDKLDKIMQPLPSDLESQIIHGDMTGNILFEDNEPPGIIDLTPYRQPAEYANAIVIADALAWCGEGRELVVGYAVDELKGNLLARALYWRLLTVAIDTDLAWVEQHFDKTYY